MGYLGSNLSDYSCHELLQEIKKQVNAEIDYEKKHNNVFSMSRLQQLENAKIKIIELLNIL